MDHNPEILENNDLSSESRKQDHIDLAFRSATAASLNDRRFCYEPVLSAHPDRLEPVRIFGKTFRAPFWVSSMTGGTEKAGRINRILATVAGRFGFGMGLGSCRSLLYSDEFLDDFNVRTFLGGDVPLYANLGIAQVEQLVTGNKAGMIDNLLKKIDADGLIIHVNPLQEWLQPGGDRFGQPPLETIRRLLDTAGYKIIVKEVGQGIGPESLRALLQLPLEGLEFAAFGGTNFARLELLRTGEATMQSSMPLSRVGHTAEEMTDMITGLSEELEEKMQCRQFIISGGIHNFLDAYYLMEKLPFPSVTGQASTMLKYAQEGEEALEQYVRSQIDGLLFAHAFLRIRQE